MSEVPVRVGFIGASSISRKGWAAIHKAGLKVTLVGSRSQEASASYIAKCIEGLGIAPEDAPSPATYEEVVTSDKVDVVYISIPVSKRDEWIRKCAANGKHVVSEKPHLSAAALCTYGELLSKDRLLFMDGTMFSHGPYIKEVVKRLPEVGSLRRLSATFSFLNGNADDIRMNPEMEPTGALGDLGWYCVRFMLHVMNFQMPTSVIGRIVESAPNGAILSFSGELTFTDKERDEVVTGSMFCSFSSTDENEFLVTGSEAYISAPNMILPPSTQKGGETKVNVVQHKMEQTGTTFTVQHNESSTAVAGEDGHEQETQMWRDVRDALVREGGALKAKSEDAQLWFKMAYMTQSILDKLLQSARSRQ